MQGKMSQKRLESREERDRWHASAATLLLGHGGETDIRGMHLTWRLILVKTQDQEFIEDVVKGLNAIWVFNNPTLAA
jgi:hypothetical protein